MTTHTAIASSRKEASAIDSTKRHCAYAFIRRYILLPQRYKLTRNPCALLCSTQIRKEASATDSTKRHCAYAFIRRYILLPQRYKLTRNPCALLCSTQWPAIVSSFYCKATKLARMVLGQILLSIWDHRLTSSKVAEQPHTQGELANATFNTNLITQTSSKNISVTSVSCQNGKSTTSWGRGN